ncbi:unnamed protein product [Echinostoma caproni]|uniref:Photolyase/cryptochrome alpha/beta domain-containing protein n=1 Tax=Echinostoma caproni TaxID=27848 RepID=A0A183BDM7_9TREM|nr:unnamed protein product [Echinostoma caproni]
MNDPATETSTTTNSTSEQDQSRRTKSGSRKQTMSEHRPRTQPESQYSLCPFFYTGSLADAVKLCERPSGRPWPVLLLYLHNDDSPHTGDFVNNILCSLREDYKFDDTCICTTQPNGPSRDRFGDVVSRVVPDKNDCLLPADLATNSTPASSKQNQRTSMFGHKEDTQQISNWVNPDKGTRASFAATRRGIMPCDQSTQTNKPDRDRDPVPNANENALQTKEKKYSPGKLVMKTTPKSTQPSNELEQNDLKCTAYNAMFPDWNYATDSDELINAEPLPLSVNYPACGEHEDLENSTKRDEDAAGKSDVNTAHGTAFKTKSFRTLLLERSAGLIPWDCTDLRGRSFLAAAFPGTRLVQWLTEWHKVNVYYLGSFFIQIHLIVTELR